MLWGFLGIFDQCFKFINHDANILLVDLMLVKAVFLIFLILFSLLSFFIDLPPGSLVTDSANLTLPYFNLLTNNLLNGIFYGSIIGLVVFLVRRYAKSKSPKYELFSKQKKRDQFNCRNLITKRFLLE